MNRTRSGKRRALGFAGVVTALTLALATPSVNAMGADGTSTVRSLYDTLLVTMRNGPSLGARGRYAQLQPVVRQVFDIPFMTRLAVGPDWESLNDAQRQQVSQAFEHYIAAVYAERFDSYSGERLQVTG